MSRDQICDLSCSSYDAFHLSNEKRKKYVMVIQPQDYIPSRVGEWDRLYHLIQRQGYQNGMHLTIGSGSYKRGGWTIICVRGRIYPKKLQILNNIDEQTSSQCFSPQSKPQNLRRVKNKNSN